MDVDELLAKANDSISVSRVYGPPIESGGAIIIPAARVAGGGGGGSGGDESGNQGSGSGHGVMARPAGAWVIREGKLSWQPAVDVNKIVLGMQVVAVIALLAWRSVARSR
jgi:uncharacterized spore protein YtfJ